MQRIAVAFLEAILTIAFVVFGIALGDFLYEKLGWHIITLIGGVCVLALIFYLIEDKEDKKDDN